jgi:hypothetical protein
VEPRHPLLAAAGDLVEVVLHPGRELVVDQVGEVLFEQAHHGERVGGRDEGLALLPHVPAVLDRLHDRRVGRRAADAQLLERLHERGLGVARRRLGGVARGLHVGGRE